MNKNKNYECVAKVKDDNLPCNQEDCRHFLSSKKNLNCSLIAAESGPLTLQEIGEYYGISRMRVCQIEKSILKKLKSNSKKLSGFE
jgi:DNA-binding CsgD family transcriptional regulator